MAKNNIYDYDPLYSFLRPYVDWKIKESYRRTEIFGKENIPEDGAVIISPNHCNTLMDALVILRAFKDGTVFGARADMFNKPAIAKAMFFFRILPMVRQRDGLRNVLKNHQTNEIIVDTLKHGVRFCMYPEGRHRPARSIMPLGKGVFRAALEAVHETGDGKDVYIVPTGLEYEDYFRFRSTSLVSFGKPLNVTQFVKDHPVENEVQLIEPLRKELYSRMSELITFLPDDENLDAKWSLLKMLAAEDGCSRNLHERMMADRGVASRIAQKEEANVEAFTSLLDKVRTFDRERRRAGISFHAFGKKKTALAWRSAASVLMLPWFVFCCVTGLPMLVVETLIRSKIKDRAFRNTGSFAVGLVMSLLMTLIWAAVSFCLMQWYWALVFVVLSTRSYYSFHDCAEFYRRTLSMFRLMCNKKMGKQYKSIITEFENL